MIWLLEFWLKLPWIVRLFIVTEYFVHERISPYILTDSYKPSKVYMIEGV
jgi:hypothetical protein